LEEDEQTIGAAECGESFNIDNPSRNRDGIGHQAERVKERTLKSINGD